MKSYLLEVIANHLNEYDNEDRGLLRKLFLQHAFLLNAIESKPECELLVEDAMQSFMSKQREELKPEEPSKIITPDRF